MIEFDPVLVHEWLVRAARRHPAKTALICSDVRMSYATLDEASSDIARFLIEKGVCRGDRVIIFMDNAPEAVVAMFGILKAGAVFIIIDGSIKAPKLRFIIENSGARLIFAYESKEKIVAEAKNNGVAAGETVWIGEKGSVNRDRESTWSGVMECGKNLKEKPLPRIIDIDLAALIYTSGSTGEPKGVMSTHHNMVSAARSIIQYIDNREDDIILNVLPLSFDYGLYQVIMSVMMCGTVIIEKSFMYNEQILQRIVTERVTGFPIVPTILAMLLRLDSLSERDFSTVRYITNTGAALPEAHIQKLRSLFPHVTIFSMFGLTECKRVCYLPPDQIDQRPKSVGIAMPNCETFVVDEDDHPVPRGQVGQLVVRGSNVMQGYWNDTATTDRTYHHGKYPADRLLYSGDFFRTDEEGFLYFTGRRDDIIKSRGERVSTREVENVLYTMPGVTEATVVAVPDDMLGLAIAAFVVTEKDAKITEKELFKHCARRLETKIIPKYIRIVEKLPRLENGKIDRRELQSRLDISPILLMQ